MLYFERTCKFGTIVRQIVFLFFQNFFCIFHFFELKFQFFSSFFYSLVFIFPIVDFCRYVAVFVHQFPCFLNFSVDYEFGNLLFGFVHLRIIYFGVLFGNLLHHLTVFLLPFDKFIVLFNPLIPAYLGLLVQRIQFRQFFVVFNPQCGFYFLLSISFEPDFLVQIRHYKFQIVRIANHGLRQIVRNNKSETFFRDFGKRELLFNGIQLE